MLAAWPPCRASWLAAICPRTRDKAPVPGRQRQPTRSRVWDLGSGTLLHTLAGHGGSAWAAAASWTAAARSPGITMHRPTRCHRQIRLLARGVI
jgi:hypothetical protein